MKRIGNRKSNPLVIGFISVGMLGLGSASAMDWSDVQYYMDLHAGAGWNTTGKNQTLSNAEGFDHYKDDSDDEIAMVYGIGGGFYLDQGSSGRIKLGVSWYGDTQHEYKGYIDQFSLQSERNHSFKYKLQSQRLVLEGSWLFPIHTEFEGFVTGGLGMSWNEFSDYKLKLLDDKDLSPKPAFKKNTNSEFAWQVGAGISWDIMSQWQLSALYLYANNGKAEAKRTDSYSGKFKTGDIASHNFILNLTYLF